VLLLDVIEHVADDRAFLDEILESSVQPGGAVVVSVPAWDLLYGPARPGAQALPPLPAGAGAARLLRAPGLRSCATAACSTACCCRASCSAVSEWRRARFRRAGNGKNGEGHADRPANLGEWRGGALLSSV